MAAKSKNANHAAKRPAAAEPHEAGMTSGADIVVQSLVNHGVDTIFAYPGGTTIPLHQALTRFRDRVRVILPRHEQGGGFAAQGYARSTGKIGVCMATSGPGAPTWSPRSPTPSSIASPCWRLPARWAPRSSAPTPFRRRPSSRCAAA